MTPVDVLVWVAIGLRFLVGFTLMGLGLYGCRLHRARLGRRRAEETDRLVEAQVAAWRAERRSRRGSELRAWDRDFAALLPAAAPCTSTDHNHVESMRIGSGTIEQICVLSGVTHSRGGAVLAPGEYVFGISSIEAVNRLREAFGRQ